MITSSSWRRVNSFLRKPTPWLKPPDPTAVHGTAGFGEGLVSAISSIIFETTAGLLSAESARGLPAVLLLIGP
jgi:hypothetical protein